MHEAVIWLILSKILTLNIAICIVLLYFGIFFSLSSVADFSKIRAGVSTSAGRAPFFTRVKSDAVWTGGLSMSHGNYSMVVFLFSS